MRSASSASKPVVWAMACSAPARYAMPTIPPPPRTRPTRGRCSVGSAGGGAAVEVPTGLLTVVLGGQVLGHGPAEDDQMVAPAGIEAVEQGGHVRVDGFGFGRIEVE